MEMEMEMEMEREREREMRNGRAYGGRDGAVRLLDEAVDDLPDLRGAVAQRPAVLREDVDEHAGEEHHEHVVHLLLREDPARVLLRLQVDVEL